MAFVLESRGQSTQELYKGEEEEVEREADEPETLQEPSSLGTQPRSQDEHVENVEKLAPIRMFYRRTDQAPLLPEHPSTPLTDAVKNLYTHLSTLIADPDLSKRSHPATLVSELESSYKALLATTRPQQTTDRTAKSQRQEGDATERKPLTLDKHGRPIWILDSKKSRKERKKGSVARGKVVAREERTEEEEVIKEMAERAKAREERWKSSATKVDE